MTLASLGLVLVIAAQAPLPADGASQDEVDALLRQINQQAAPPPPVTPQTPHWLDLVVPVAELRMRPFLLLGHPASSRQAQLKAQTRALLGVEFHPHESVAGRLVLNAHPSFPELQAPGPDLLMDAWIQWSYAALGGEFRLRAGRQEAGWTELLLSADPWLMRPFRVDGLHARLQWKWFYVAGFAGAQALMDQPPSGQTLPPVHALAFLQAGIQQKDRPERHVEVHALLRQANAPLHGDTSTPAGPAMLDLGLSASWDWQGAFARLALDAQQSRWTTPSVYLPALGSAGALGYAPEFPWMMGLYAEVGYRVAGGQPMDWLPGVRQFYSFSGVEQQEFEPLMGVQHGVLGEMDLVRMQNVYGIFARAGVRRDRLRDLSITVHRLSLLSVRADWTDATGTTRYLGAREGGPDLLLGHEADLAARASLTRHLDVGGVVGLLVAGPKAREAGFSGFAETAWLFVDLRL